MNRFEGDWSIPLGAVALFWGFFTIVTLCLPQVQCRSWPAPSFLFPFSLFCYALLWFWLTTVCWVMIMTEYSMLCYDYVLFYYDYDWLCCVMIMFSFVIIKFWSGMSSYVIFCYIILQMAPWHMSVVSLLYGVIMSCSRSHYAELYRQE